jgi:hypothetical protein
MQQYRRSADIHQLVVEHLRLEQQRKVDEALAYWRPYFEEKERQRQRNQIKEDKLNQ